MGLKIQQVPFLSVEQGFRFTSRYLFLHRMYCMKFFFVLFIIMAFSTSAYTQKLEGVWAGYFLLVPDSIETSFLIEFLKEKDQIIAFTRTEFKLNKRKYYSICKAEVTIDSLSQKIIVTEYDYVKTDTPFQGCFQKHVLWYDKNPEHELLVGTWTTAGNRNCGKGTTTLERKNTKSTANQY
jgi:hypothetical protein